MSYIINVTNQTPITIADGTTDTSTSLTLIGKNVSNYGQIIMQDLVNMVQNFASTNQPLGPLDGQLWYDTSIGGLKVYYNNEFKILTTITSSSIEPQNATLTGDLWWDSINNLLKLWDGTQWVAIGPSVFEGSNLLADTILDSDNIARGVVKVVVNSVTVAIYSLIDFIPKVSLAGFPKIIRGVTFATSYGALVTDQTAENIYTTNGIFWSGNGEPYSTNPVTTLAGPNTAVQFNNNGDVDGTAGFTFNSVSNAVAIGGTLTATNIISRNQITGYFNGAIGASSANTGAFTTVTASGNVTVGNLSVTSAGGQVRGYLNGVIGANGINSGSFTTLSSTGQTNLGNTAATKFYTTSGIFWTGNGQAWSSSAGVAGAKFTASSTAPTGASPGDEWYDTSSDILYVYARDGANNLFWIDISTGSGGGGGGGSGVKYTASANPPTAPSVGDEWYDTTSDTLYIYADDGLARAWVDFVSIPSSYSANLIPGANVTNDLGSSSLNWNRVYANNIVTINGIYWANGTAFSSGTGGTGTPGGSSTQLQFNDAGSFGGATNVIYNKTNGNLAITSTTGSIGKTTGALVVSGGAGISGDVYASSFRADNGQGLYFQSTSHGFVGQYPIHASIVTGGIYRVYVDQNGNVGINTSNPTSALHVIGNITGYFNGAIGANGANTGSFTTVTASGNVTVGNLSVAGIGGQVRGYLNGAIGANGANTGTFTSLTATSLNINSAYSFPTIDGTNGYYLQTNGAGVVSWVAGTGGGGSGTPSGSDTQVQYNDSGAFGGSSSFTFNKTTGNVTVGNISVTGLGGQVRGYITGAIGANAANTGAFTTLTASSTATIIGNASAGNISAVGLGGQVTGYLTGAIGSNIANTGAFTTVTTTGLISGPTVNAATIGNSGALITGTLQTASQTNITAVGTLSSLTVSGSATAGNFTTTSSGQLIGYHTGAIGANTPNTGAFTTLSATSLTINGAFTFPTADGTNGYFLQTNGSGQLNWSAAPSSGGGGTPGGGDTQVQFNNSGAFGGNSSFTFNKTTGNVTVGNIAATGIGGQLTGYHTGAIGANTPNTGAFTSITTTGDISLSTNNKSLKFTTTDSNVVSFVQQSDDNFVMYSTSTAGTQRPIWSVYANSNTSVFSLAVQTQVTGNLTVGNISTTGVNGQVIGYHTGAIGAFVPNTGAFTSVTSTGSVTVNAPGQLIGYHTGAIGSNIANTGTFTTVTTGTLSTTSTATIIGNATAGNLSVTGAGGQVRGYITGAIGANVANTGAFTTITASSTIGIGTNNPASPLHVVGAMRAGAGPIDATNASISMYNDGTGASIEAFQGSNSLVKRNIWLNAYGGNVGVGTTNPLSKLDVAGNIYQNGSSITPWINVVTNYGADPTGANDSTTAINNAIAQVNSNGGSVLYFPKGIYKVTTLNAINCNGVQVIGAGRDSTIIKTTSATGDVITLGGYMSRIEGFTLRPTVHRTSGYALNVYFASQAIIKDIFIEWDYNGIWINDSSSCYVDSVTIRNLTGVFGLVSSGTVGNGVYGLYVTKLLTDAPYYVTPINPKGNFANNTLYAFGDVVISNGWVWQCVVAGTSAASGSLTVPTSAAGSFMWTYVTSFTAQFKAVFNSGLIWVQQGSYANSMSLSQCALLNGNIGVKSQDDANTGTSYPNWIYCFDLETDHSYYAGVLCSGGLGFHATASWIGSCLTGNGVTITDNFLGEAVFTDCRILGNAQYGMLFNVGKDYKVSNSIIAMNGTSLTNYSFNDIQFGAGVTRFTVSDNSTGIDTINLSCRTGYGIAIASTCDNFIVTNNLSNGNFYGGVLNSAGTSTTKVVSIGGGGSSTAANPGGSDTQIQFNDGGSTFGADSKLTFNKTSGLMTLGGNLYFGASGIGGMIKTTTTTNAPTLTFVNGGLNLNADNNGPAPVLTISGPNDDIQMLVSGTTKGIRVGTNTYGALIEGVDSTGSGSYNPLILGGNVVSVSSKLDVPVGNVTIGGSDNLGFSLAVFNGSTLVNNNVNPALSNPLRNNGVYVYQDKNYGMELGYDGSKYTTRIMARSDSSIEFGRYPWYLDANIADFVPSMTVNVVDNTVNVSGVLNWNGLNSNAGKTGLKYVTPQMYGAAGNGTADDTTALSNALNSGYPVKLYGKFRITSTVTVNLTSSVFGLSIEGGGASMSKIIIDFTTGNGLVINVADVANPWGSASESIVMRDFTFEPNKINLSYACVINGKIASGSSQPTFLIDNVNVIPSATNFGTANGGFYFNDCRGSTIRSCTICGYYGQYYGAGIRWAGSSLSAPVHFTIDNCFIYWFESGVQVNGASDPAGSPGSWQGVTVDKCYILSCSYGVKADSGTDNFADDLKISNTHLNYGIAGVYAQNVSALIVVNNTFLLSGLTGTVYGVYTSITSGKSDYGSIINNFFHSYQVGATTKYAIYGVQTSGASRSAIHSNRALSCNGGYVYPTGSYNAVVTNQSV